VDRVPHQQVLRNATGSSTCKIIGLGPVDITGGKGIKRSSNHIMVEVSTYIVECFSLCMECVMLQYIGFINKPTAFTYLSSEKKSKGTANTLLCSGS
jgi:hypothetical protein